MPSTTNLFLLGKCVILTAYHAVICGMGLGWTFKFVTFHVFTPIAKYFHFNRLNTSRDRHLFAFSLANDLIVSTLYYGMFLPRLVGPLFVLYPYALTILMIIMEVVQHRVLYRGTSYDITMSHSPLDYLLVPVYATYFFAMGSYMDFGELPDAMTFPLFLLLTFAFDVQFGFLHYLAHTVPSIYKRHLLHHQYKKEKLCFFANFHSELPDALLMIAGFVPISLFLCWLGRDHIIMMELTMMLASTHQRYNGNQLNMIYFFEWDLIDMVFGEQRISCYHAHHHHEPNENFAVFGLISDETIKGALPHQ